jgi:hypothetical protein
VSLLEIRAIAVLLILSALGIAGWQLISAERKIGAQACEMSVARATAAAQAAGSATEADWQRRVLDVHRQSEIQIGNATAERDAALALVRQRAPRRPDLPASAAAACAGARGADVSAQDAANLVNLAYDADRLRAAYDELRAWAETVAGVR